MKRYAAIAAAMVVALSVSACGDDDEPTTDATPTESATQSPSETGSSTPTDEPSESTSAPTESQTAAEGLPEPGTAEAPAPVTPATDLLDFTPEGDPATPNADTQTMGTKYMAVINEARTLASVGVAHSGDVVDLKAPPGYHWNEALLDGEWAVVVAQHDQESKPAVGTVFNLAKGTRTTLSSGSDPATVNGGSWQLGQGRVFHPTTGRDNAYCLAEVDLATGAGQTTYCAEPKTGFNNVNITPAGLTLTSFDSGQISCRTPMMIGEAAMEPVPGIARCKGWEALAMPDGNAVFSVIEKENRIEQAEVVAKVGDGFFDLGPSTSGSLMWCGDAAWFSQDPQTSGDPARLLRWDGTSLTVVYEGGAGGEASISEPRCGGDAITVSLLSEVGDEQVTAPIG